MNNRRIGLLIAFRAQVLIDATNERRVQFLFYRKQRAILGRIYRFFELFAGPTLKTLVCFFYGAIESEGRLNYSAGQLLAVHGKRNEELRFRELERALHGFDVSLAAWPARVGWLDAVTSLVKWARGPDRKRILRILRKLNEKYPLYVVMRAAAVLMIYQNLKARFSTERPAGILFSTASNPYGLALMGVARSLGLPAIYGTHGPISSGPLKLHCDLGLFYGHAAFDLLLKENSRIGGALYYGFKEVYRKPVVKTGRRIARICICLSKNFDLARVQSLIAEVSKAFRPDEIRIRAHPDGLARLPENRLTRIAGVVLSRAREIENDLEGCDLVIGGVSTVHLEALLRGVPAVFAPAMDWGKTDLLAFLQEGLVPRWESVVDGGEWAERLARHYAQPLWEKNFSHYMNVDSRSADFEKLFRERIARFTRETRASQSRPSAVDHQI